MCSNSGELKQLWNRFPSHHKCSLKENITMYWSLSFLFFFFFKFFLIPNQSRTDVDVINKLHDLIPRAESASSIHFFRRLNQSWLHEKQELKTTQCLSNSLFDFIPEEILSYFCFYLPKSSQKSYEFCEIVSETL